MAFRIGSAGGKQNSRAGMMPPSDTESETESSDGEEAEAAPRLHQVAGMDACTMCWDCP